MNIRMCVLIVGIIATSLMTIFSYIYASLTNYQYSEPKLLNYVLVTSKFSFFRKIGEKKIIGWILHYLIGIVGAYLFYRGIHYCNFYNVLGNGIFYGIIFSVFGISGWACLLFKDFPIPNVYFRGFFLHLILAHLIYGSSIAFCFYYI